MKQPLTEKLLYIIATVADYNRRNFSWQLALSLPDDPRNYKYRRWLERILKNKKQRQKLYDALRNLKRCQCLQEKVFNNTKGYILTAKGKLKIFKTEIKNLQKKKFTSGQYLMVFFDIPEKIKKIREIFRICLKDLGFEQVQKSVWVTPYNVREEVKELITRCEVGEYAKVLMVEEFDK